MGGKENLSQHTPVLFRTLGVSVSPLFRQYVIAFRVHTEKMTVLYLLLYLIQPLVHCLDVCVADKPDEKVTESDPENMNVRTKLFDVSSKIRLTPSADDDGVKYSCEGQHESLPSDMAMRKSVQLSVLCK